MPAYLKLGDIKGDVTDNRKSGDVDSFSFGANNGGSTTYTATDDMFKFKDMKKGGGDGYTEVEWTYAEAASNESESKNPPPAEDISLNFEKIKLASDEGTGYTATDDLFG